MNDNDNCRSVKLTPGQFVVEVPHQRRARVYRVVNACEVDFHDLQSWWVFDSLEELRAYTDSCGRSKSHQWIAIKSGYEAVVEAEKP